MDDIHDLINDLPEALADGSDTGAGRTTAVVDDDDHTQVDETEEVEEQETEEDETQEDESEEETDKGDKSKAEEDDEDDQSQYIADPDETEEEVSPTANNAVVTEAREIIKQSQDEFVLSKLQKITVQVIGQDDKVYTIQAYGNGDLPADMKDFASKYAEKQWDAQVNSQEVKARELIAKYQQAKETVNAMNAQEDWVRKENIAIRDDLNELIKDGIFPHFKGEPGTKEFEESAGGKEFDKVIKYMNEQNAKYRERGNSGKAYRHIGFHEAFIMLNGPNSKQAEKDEGKARKVVAKKLKSGGGTKNDTRTVSTKQVANLTDLDEEFSAFIGSTK